MTGSIALIDGVLRVSGTSPFRCVFTPRIAKTILTLPPVSGGGESWAAASILNNLDEESQESFKRLLSMDGEVRALYGFLRDNFAIIAFPKERAWPALHDNREVLEELLIDCTLIKVLMCTITGQRFVCPTLSDGYSDRMSFPEFEHAYGRTVYDHMSTIVRPRIERLERALLIANIDEPEPEVDIQVGTAGPTFALSRVRIRQFLPDQIEDYLRRHGLYGLDSAAVKKP